jgi:peptidoglycan/LPS O-acetylase OafA/YrhL
MNKLSKYSRFSYFWILNKLQWVYQALATLLEGDKPQGKNSIAVLDGVRAFAILFVITFHINRMNGDNLWSRTAYPLATSVSTAGGTGVTLFFVLSGFLLFMPYAKALLFKTQWPLARVFYLRRFLRIVPGYYVSLFLIILLFQPQYLQPDHWRDVLLFLTFFMDSSQSTFRQINGPFWTLAIEWQFYMILPLITLGISLAVKRVPIQRRLQAVTLCLLSIVVWGLCLRVWGFYYFEHPSETFLVPRSVLHIVLFFTFGITGKFIEDFAVGMLVSLCYVYAQHPSTGGKLATGVRRLSPWLWGGGILILVFSAMWHFNHDMQGWSFLNRLFSYYDNFSDILLAIGYGACIAAILFGPAELKRPFEWPILRWIGLISYSLYIWHLPLLIFLRDHVLPLFHGLGKYSTYSLYWVWALLIIVPFCLLFYLFIEKPCMQLGDNLRRKIEQQRKQAAARTRETIADQVAVREREPVKL